jgi:c-di-GMP-binding flagellar brake protein YcgR
MSMHDKLSRFLTERRQAKRRKAQREVSLVVGIAIEGGIEAVVGRTRDLSETGLSLSLPLENPQREQIVPRATARILLVLPQKTISMHVEIRHIQPLDEYADQGSLLGVQITHLDVDDKALYIEYLSSLM